MIGFTTAAPGVTTTRPPESEWDPTLHANGELTFAPNIVQAAAEIGRAGFAWPQMPTTTQAMQFLRDHKTAVYAAAAVLLGLAILRKR